MGNNVFTDEQIAGIMGNMQQECGWNPLAINQNNRRWGLIQISSENASLLDDLYEKAGIDMSLYGHSVGTYQGAGAHQDIPLDDLEKIMEVQLDFIYDHRPTGSDWISKLKDTTSAPQAAECFAIYCEGCVQRNPEYQSEETLLIYYPDREDKHYQDVGERRDNADDILYAAQNKTFE